MGSFSLLHKVGRVHIEDGRKVVKALKQNSPTAVFELDELIATQARL